MARNDVPRVLLRSESLVAVLVIIGKHVLQVDHADHGDSAPTRWTCYAKTCIITDPDRATMCARGRSRRSYPESHVWTRQIRSYVAPARKKCSLNRCADCCAAGAATIGRGGRWSRTARRAPRRASEVACPGDGREQEDGAGVCEGWGIARALCPTGERYTSRRRRRNIPRMGTGTDHDLDKFETHSCSSRTDDDLLIDTVGSYVGQISIQIA